jgi:hypothetical protein
MIGQEIQVDGILKSVEELLVGVAIPILGSSQDLTKHGML